MARRDAVLNDSVNVAVRVDKELFDRLMLYSIARKLTRSAVVRECMVLTFDRNDGLPASIREADERHVREITADTRRIFIKALHTKGVELATEVISAAERLLIARDIADEDEVG